MLFDLPCFSALSDSNRLYCPRKVTITAQQNTSTATIKNADGVKIVV
jgi:hypothetical protein